MCLRQVVLILVYILILYIVSSSSTCGYHEKTVSLRKEKILVVVVCENK